MKCLTNFFSKLIFERNKLYKKKEGWKQIEKQVENPLEYTTIREEDNSVKSRCKWSNTKADGNDIYIYETSEISDSQKKKKIEIRFSSSSTILKELKLKRNVWE